MRTDARTHKHTHTHGQTPIKKHLLRQQVTKCLYYWSKALRYCNHHQVIDIVRSHHCQQLYQRQAPLQPAGQCWWVYSCHTETVLTSWRPCRQQSTPWCRCTVEFCRQLLTKTSSRRLPTHNHVHAVNGGGASHGLGVKPPKCRLAPQRE